MTRLPGAITIAVVACVSLVGSASATWSPPALLSERGGERAFGENGSGDGSTQPDLTPDGRFAVFSTTARNLVAVPDADPLKFRRGGLVRRELATGALALIAPGERSLLARPFSNEGAGASRPSISANGRFVAFQTDDALRPDLDTNGRRDVYVRDMDRAIDDPAAYELISARDGSAGGANFGGSSAAGASIARVASAVSDDGNRVLFFASAASDLLAAGTPSDPLPTPAGQLFVRVRDRQATLPVNVERDADTGLPTDRPVGGAVGNDLAALSADGSTVIWVSTGSAAVLQTRTLLGEQAAEYQQFLYRRLDETSQPIRRVAAAADPDDTACPSTGSVSSQRGPAVSPCDGPLALRTERDVPVVSGPMTLSADGRRVAWVTAWPVRAQPDLASTVQNPDAMMVDINEDRPRKRSFREITRSEPLAQPSFTDLAFSADGATLVVAATNLTLPLPAPAFIGPPPLDLQASQLYAIDLQRDTIEVLTRGLAEASPNGVTSAPAVSADGRRVVFASEATNLVAGDGNGLTDVFSSDVAVPEVRAVGQQLPPRRPAAQLETLPRLRVTARPLARGRIRVTAIVPDAGVITAAVQRRSTARARPVARVSTRAATSGTHRLTVILPRAQRRQALRSGLVVRVAVAFTAANGTTLRREVRCVFAIPRRAVQR